VSEGTTHEVFIHTAPAPIRVPDNANLREAFLREGKRLYFGLGRFLNCGGRGRCGTCLVRVLEGAEPLSPRTPHELARLKAMDPTLRLACQAQVRGPVRVDPRG
jgi:ferredoxin